jgi:hypothetical protein
LRGNRLSRMFNRLVVDLFPDPFRLPLHSHSRRLPILYNHEPRSKLRKATVGPFDAIILISMPTRLGGPGGQYSFKIHLCSFIQDYWRSIQLAGYKYNNSNNRTAVYMVQIVYVQQEGPNRNPSLFRFPPHPIRSTIPIAWRKRDHLASRPLLMVGRIIRRPRSRIAELGHRNGIRSLSVVRRVIGDILRVGVGGRGGLPRLSTITWTVTVLFLVS